MLSRIAARQHIESLPTCRLPYGVFLEPTITPRISKIGNRSTLANAAEVLDHVSQNNHVHSTLEEATIPQILVKDRGPRGNYLALDLLSFDLLGGCLSAVVLNVNSRQC